MRSFCHNVLASLHFLSVDHQLLDKFQNGSKILKYLKANSIKLVKLSKFKLNSKTQTCLKRCPLSHLLNEAK